VPVTGGGKNAAHVAFAVQQFFFASAVVDTVPAVAESTYRSPVQAKPVPRWRHLPVSLSQQGVLHEAADESPPRVHLLASVKPVFFFQPVLQVAEAEEHFMSAAFAVQHSVRHEATSAFGDVHVAVAAKPVFVW
jgi:hypothetical protein